MISTYYRRPGPAAPAPMFDPSTLIDPLMGPVPTWRLDLEVAPVYLDVVRDLGIPGLGTETVSAPAGDVVEGVVLEGPPTVPLSIVGPPTVPLPLAEMQQLVHVRRQPKRRTRKRPNRQLRHEAGSGSAAVMLFVVVLAVVAVALMAGFLGVAESFEFDVRDHLPVGVPLMVAGCPGICS